MAAEFVLTFATEGILTKVSSLAAQELSLAWGFKAELRKLGESLSIIQDFLRGAADRKAKDQGKAVEKWVKKLKAIAEDADDVLDEFNYELLRRKVELQNHIKRKVLNFLSASNPLFFRLKMAHRIKKINESLVELKNQANLMKMFPKGRDSEPGGERPTRDQTDSFFEHDEKVVGREDDVKNIVETLINSNNRKNHSVMAIVGMPGLGKTTLAKTVFNEPAIDAHFHKKIWVCVSNSFEVDVILSQMLYSLNDPNAGSTNRDALIRSLREQLKEKKYVLVLDDVWSEDGSKWESLMSCLSKLNSTPGSSIIITTRSADVATIAEAYIAETLPRPKLRNLSNDECWSILKQRALNLGVTDSAAADLEGIGRAIAEKCGGIPLVAKILGSIMRSKATKDEWLAIQNSEIWGLPEEKDRIMSVLKLSFDNLKSSSLKQCFSYCSLLKKDFEIERDTLIQLWMAQGLLQPSSDNAHHEMEDTGNEYFNILLKNSLFQEATEYGNITKYTMHDLVHDLAEEVSKGESLTRDLNHTCEVRHVARIPTSRLENMPDGIVRRLHSLFSDDHVPDVIFSKFRALRVLNLHEAKIQELSNSIGKLKHLRYLDVSYTGIKALPKSIGRLYNLQTLRMQGTELEELPREMQDLINLRHLYFDKKVEFPAGMFRRLTNLRTLRYFNVGKEMGVGIEELAGLNQLKGKVTIRNLENVRHEEDAKKAKLEDKQNILELSFVWTESEEEVQEGLEGRQSCNSINVLEGLQPHTNLKSLAIKNFMGDKFPSWMMRKPFPLNNLKKLLLVGCLKCEGLPTLGHLPSLSHVRISKMNNLKSLGSEFYGYNHVTGENDTKVLFPALKALRIGWCHELTEWQPPATIIEIFPCLEELSLLDCPLLNNAPSHFPSLKKLTISGMDSEKPLTSICSEVSTLTHLEIDSIKGLSLLSSEMLKKNKNLTSLSISGCDEMIRISSNVFGCCSNLRELDISYRIKLEHLAEGLDTLPLLEKLRIRLCPKLESIPIAHDMASLRELEIEECDGLSCIGVLDHCTSLQQLKITGCRNLTSLPISEGLRVLVIRRCDGLTRSGIENCTSLEELEIEECSSLATISFTRVLPSLRRFEVEDCPELSYLPDLEYCPSLQELRVWNCPKLASISSSTDFNPCLEKLYIVNCNGLQAIPDFCTFTSLRELKLSECAGIESLVCGFHMPVSLQDLVISYFHNLESIPSLEKCASLRGLHVVLCCLAPLKSLSLGPFWEELDSFPDFQVPSQQLIDSLWVYGWPKLESLPQQVQHFQSLTWLTIDSFNGVEVLPEWLGNLASLETLFIWNCANLKYLPSLKALERLTKLNWLRIEGCPLLEERCTRDSGEEWPKISHIPEINLNDW